MEILASSALLTVVFLLLLRAFRQSRTLLTLAPSPTVADEDAPKLAVIVPARDEAANIVACLSRLAAQDYPSSRLRIIVVDDNSKDGTGEIIAAFAARRSNVTILRSGPLAAGWTGKSQACWIGAQSAPADVEWLCFVDADTQSDPRLIGSAVAVAQRLRLGLLSLAPRQILSSFAERLMIPCGLYLLSFSQNLARLQAPEGEDASATGQFMLAQRDAYGAVGGHAAAPGAICEDLELARRLKRSGYPVLLMNGASLISARMYDGWRTLWPGFAKNLLTMFGGPVAALSMAVAAIALGWSLAFLPIVDYADCATGSASGCAALGLAATASLAALGFHIAGAFYLGVPLWYGLLFPLGYTLGAVMVLDALRRRATGRVLWKGRVYHG